MKKVYNKVEIEFVELLSEDIVRTSDIIPERVNDWPEEW